MCADLEEVPGGTYLSRCSRTGLTGVATGHDELVILPPRVRGGEQESTHRFELPREPKLTVELPGPLLALMTVAGSPTMQKAGSPLARLTST